MQNAMLPKDNNDVADGISMLFPQPVVRLFQWMDDHGNDAVVLQLRTASSARSLLFLRAGDFALDQAIGARLGGVHLGVFAGVLVALVPAQVCKEVVSIEE